MQKPFKGISVNHAFVLLRYCASGISCSKQSASKSAGATLSNTETLDCVSSIGCFDQKFDHTFAAYKCTSNKNLKEEALGF